MNLTDPSRTVPCRYHSWGMPGWRAGSPIAVQYMREYKADTQNRAGKGSIYCEDDSLFLLSCYLSMGVEMRLCWELNQLTTTIQAAWPYKDMLCVRRWGDTRPAGRVNALASEVCTLARAKTGQQKVQFYCKTLPILLYYLSMNLHSMSKIWLLKIENHKLIIG